MTRLKSSVFTVAVLIVSLVGAVWVAHNKGREKVATSLTAFDFSANVSKDLAFDSVPREDAIKALKGDPLVAMSLAVVFAKRELWPNAEYWFQIAAENGSPEAMQHLSVIWKDSNCHRAVFWKRRSVEAAVSLGRKGRSVDELQAELTSYVDYCEKVARAPRKN